MTQPDGSPEASVAVRAGGPSMVRVVYTWYDRSRAVNLDGRVRAHGKPQTGPRCRGSGRDSSTFELAPSLPCGVRP
jgi:hypothetical protein